MIKLYKNIEELDTKLNNLKSSGTLCNYKVILDSNNRITTYLKPAVNKSILESLRKDFPLSFFVNLEEDDDSYDFVFENGNGTDITTSRIHLSNLLDENSLYDTKEYAVVTFYSYKGGVGRSTSLASFASHLAIKDRKKVVILDCDFEAPGFTNFFLEDPSNIYYKNGLVEFFMDSATDEDHNLSSYYWEVSKKFSGEGGIYIFPSGNLSSEVVDNTSTTHLNHYLNGLSRLDIFNQETIVEKFRNLFARIYQEIKPDVILLDSRTGFNDIFGISAFRLSDIVVGFFGIDVQSKPGLTFFLESINRKVSPRIILVNSIIPSFAKSKLFANFKEYAEDVLQSIQSEEDAQNNGIYEVKTFPIGYNDILKNIGLPISNYEDYISLIENDEFIDYTNLFNYIEESIEDLKHVDFSRVVSTEGIGELYEENKKNDDNTKFLLKRQLLDNIIDNLPQLYAESIIDYENEYSSNRYFYRKCMEDLFNPEKFLVLGNKGTGKTYIYRSLANDHIVEELRKRANKVECEYEFVQIINSEHRFDTLHLDNQIGDFPQDLFFERFWKIYIWNVLMKAKSQLIKPSVDTFEVLSDTATAQKIVSYIKNDDIIVNIERDLYNLDQSIRRSDDGRSKVIFIFDELDSIVKPYLWTNRISPLINYCRRMQFTCISPKLFLRSDLYNRTANINNRNELLNRTINIEWQKDEMFAYFFKFVLSHSKTEFFQLMRLYGYYPSFYVNRTISLVEKAGNQPPVDQYTLRHMCATFFGKYADRSQSARYGESYDWFYNNLKNANETISLRPFIDLIRYAVIDAKDDKTEMPILPASYFTNSRVRVKAVVKHFEDISQEKGNTDLKIIFEYIRDKAERKYKRDKLTIEKFSVIANNIIEEGKLKEVKDVDSMLDLLLVNGIVREQYGRMSYGSQKFIQFALLYKYYLGLGSRQKKQ